MVDSQQEAAMRAGAAPDPVATAHAKLDAALALILDTAQQHGVITLTLRRHNGAILVDAVVSTTQRV